MVLYKLEAKLLLTFILDISLNLETENSFSK